MKNFKITIDTEFEYADESKEDAINNFTRDNIDMTDMDFEIEEIKKCEHCNKVEVEKCPDGQYLCNNCIDIADAKEVI